MLFSLIVISLLIAASIYLLKMSNKFEEINMKNCTYYFFNYMTNIKKHDPNKIKIDKMSYKNILIYYIGYVTVKNLSYIIISSVNSLYLNINKVNECIKKNNEKISGTSSY